MSKRNRFSRRLSLLFSLPIILTLVLPTQLIAYPTAHLRQGATATSQDGARRLIEAFRGAPLATQDGGVKLAGTVQELFQSVLGVLEVTPTGVRVLDEETLRTKTVFPLVNDARFNKDPLVKASAQRLLREAGLALGIQEASIHPFYMARHTADAWSNLTVPAYNMRNGFEQMLQVLGAVTQDKVGPFIFELAKSELRYTGQRPDEYTAIAYGAAIAEGYRGPLFLQADHYQVDAGKYAKDPGKALGDLEKQIREDILAGRRNIDVDPSTLVNEDALNKVLAFERRIATRYIEGRSKVDGAFAQRVQELGGLKESPEQESEGIWSLRRKLVDDLEVVALSTFEPGRRQALMDYLKNLDASRKKDPYNSLEVFGISPESYSNDLFSRFELSGRDTEEIRALYREMHQTTYDVTMHFIRFIRAIEKELGLNTPISIGVEERHIDNPKHKKYPSTILGSITLMRQVIDAVAAEGLVQPSKLALQTGTMHGVGGKVDWGIFARHQLARKAIGVSVFVQHGTSTLPPEEFANMPPSGAGEAHLATEYQKIDYHIIATRVPWLRDKMAAYLEALVYPDKEITDPDIEARLQEAGLLDKEKRQKDYAAKYQALWAAIFGHPEPYEGALADLNKKLKTTFASWDEVIKIHAGKSREEILVEVLGDTLGGKFKGTVKDLAKEASAPFKYEIANVPPEVQAQIAATLFAEFRRIHAAQNLVGTRELFTSLFDLKAQNVVLPPRPFETATFAQARDTGEVDTTGEDGGNKTLAEVADQLNAELLTVTNRPHQAVLAPGKANTLAIAAGILPLIGNASVDKGVKDDNPERRTRTCDAH